MGLLGSAIRFEKNATVDIATVTYMINMSYGGAIE
jgi:hypothetical protein